MKINPNRKPFTWETNEQGCYLVTSHSKDRYGYVQLKRFGKSLRAHRFIYEALYGPIQEGMVVMHSCDNRSCINPEHLSLGTIADNNNDMMNKMRHWKPSGVDIHCAKLLDSDIEWIKEHGHSMTARQIGEKFGITKKYASAIRGGSARRKIK